ncbi:MAG: hypothetical protein LQ348_001062 [Seirophora lacunosa]|nr:MAG: hypothetical protein LQ348_001062 [Seirophora lacunosa]
MGELEECQATSIIKTTAPITLGIFLLKLTPNIQARKRELRIIRIKVESMDADRRGRPVSGRRLSLSTEFPEPVGRYTTPTSTEPPEPVSIRSTTSTVSGNERSDPH